MRFFGLWKIVFLRTKKFLFSLQSQKALFLVLFWSNRNKEEMAFLANSIGWPLWFFFTLKNSVFYGQKRFPFCLQRHWVMLFSLQSLKAFFRVLFWPNLNKEDIGIFWSKAWASPFWKMRVFGLWKSLSFLYSKRFLSSLESHWVKLLLVLFWPKTNKEKSWHFSHQKDGLILLGRCNFWDFL